MLYLICLFEIHNNLLKTADLIIQVMEPDSEQTIVNVNTLIENFYNKLYMEITGENSYTYRSKESAQAIRFLTSVSGGRILECLYGVRGCRL